MKQSKHFCPLQDSYFFIPMLVLVFIVLILEWAGVFFGLFHSPSLAYDKILHFLAGSTCGVFGIFLLKIGGGVRYCDLSRANRRILILAILSALSIGVWWEILQTLLPALRNTIDYDWNDTVGDVIFDTIGGVVAGLSYQTRK